MGEVGEVNFDSLLTKTARLRGPTVRKSESKGRCKQNILAFILKDL